MELRVCMLIVYSLVCVTVKVCKGCNMSRCLFNVYTDAVMKEVKMGMGRMGVRFLEEGEIEDNLFSCMQMTWFCMVSR